MNILCQRDPRWKDIKIYDLTIGQVGCTSTVISEIIGTTPDIFVKRMKDVGGFSGNLIIWAKIAQAFPGISVYRYFGYNNDAVKAAVPNVIVESSASPIGGSGRHWTRYMGNQRLHDPWTGTDRSTADFPDRTGYAVISGSWTQADPLDKVISDIRSACDEQTTNVSKISKIKYLISQV